VNSWINYEEKKATVWDKGTFLDNYITEARSFKYGKELDKYSPMFISSNKKRVELTSPLLYDLFDWWFVSIECFFLLMIKTIYFMFHSLL